MKYRHFNTQIYLEKPLIKTLTRKASFLFHNLFKFILAFIKLNYVAGEHVGGNGTSELVVASFIFGGKLGLHSIYVRAAESSHHASITDNSFK